MTRTFDRPWADADDFAKVAATSDSWTAMAKAYTAQGYPTSRDAMRRAGTRHGIHPSGGKANVAEAELRGTVDRLERQLMETRREAQKLVDDAGRELQQAIEAAEQQVRAAEARPREADPQELVDARKAIETLRTQLNSEKLVSKAAIKQSLLLDEVRAILEPIVEEYRMPPVTPPDPLGDPNRDKVSMGLVWCDQHWGKVVDPVTVDGLNNYNPVIAALRFETSVMKARRVRRLWEGEYDVDELVLILNGDPVNNDHQLHPDDANDCARVSKQVMDCALVTAQGLRDLAHEFRVIRVVCCGADNHGRGSRKPAAGKSSIENSWTALYHEQVASLCMDIAHIEFEHSPSYQALFRVKGRMFAAAHGHQLRGGGGQLGLPVYGMKRHADATVQKTVQMLKAKDWTKVTTPEEFVDAVSGVVDHVILSHFHSRQVLDFGGVDVRLAPSLVGLDTYVYNSLGKLARAGVLAFIVHPEHGIMADHLLDVQKVMDEREGRYRWGALEDGTTGAAIMRSWIQDTSTAV